MKTLKRFWRWVNQPNDNWLIALAAAVIAATLLLLLVYLLQNFLGGLL